MFGEVVFSVFTKKKKKRLYFVQTGMQNQ